MDVQKKQYYISTVYIAFIAVGTILSIVSLFINGDNSFIILLTAYSCILLGIIILMGSTMNEYTQIGKVNNVKDIFQIFQFSLGPFFIILFILSFLIYLCVRYQDKISQGHVSPSYFIFSNISLLLVLTQVAILYTSTHNKDAKTSPSSMYTSLLYFVGVINIIFVITLDTILKYFSADG